MGKVRSFAYRRPLTAKGLEKIEKDTMELYEPDMYANFNTGTLEQYMDEKYRIASFRKKQWVWKKVAVGIIIGAIFAVINQYVGLKVGMIVAGNWYLMYMIGLALRWSPTEINISSGASTGASATCTGFVFTYPAIYLLAYHTNYVGEGGSRLIYPGTIPAVSIALVSCLLAGFLGVLFFTIFRKIWLIEDPLPVPGFEATIKLLDIANDLTAGSVEKARKSLKIISAYSIVTGLFVFLRDFPLIKGDKTAVYVANRAGEISILDSLFRHSKWYLRGDLIQPYETDMNIYTHIGFGLSPMMMTIGWFMKMRSAFLLSAGTLLTWFVVIPLALGINVPVYWAEDGVYYSVTEPMKFLNAEAGLTPAMIAYSKVAVPIAIGAILGGGITALVKMSKVFKTSAEDILKLKGKERKDYIKGKGWYEWPTTHIPVAAVIAFVGVATVFSLAGFPVPQSIALSIVLIIVTFFLCAIAVKVMGEVRSTPVSGTSFITLLILVGVLTAMGTPKHITLIMALLGTTVFGTVCSLSADIIGDFKAGMYCGTKPYNLIKGEITGMLPGAIAAAIGATILSYGLATGALNLAAPQAHAFATFSQVIMGGKAPYDLLLLGFCIGVFAEIATGMGTAFGLGMYLPLSVTLPILFGGILRDIWEKKWLEPKAKAERWDEKTKTLKIINTYMVGTGLLIGEAIVGTIIAIYLVIPLFTGG